MDERLEKALEFSNYRATIENQKRNLKSRVTNLQTVSYNNGTWLADHETISFVHTLLSLSNDSAIIQDTRGNPVEINDLKEFQDILVSAYNGAMSEYHTESKKLAKARNIKKIMDW